MAPRAPKACAAGCGELVVGQTYCPDCQLEKRRTARLSPSSRHADASRAERRRRKAAVDAWVATNGWVCPGWEREPHESRDLTAAHARAVAKGGGDGPLTVLCRACNSRQALTPTA